MCDLLSKCELPQLTKLTLFFCEISNIGISHIMNGKWEKLKSINIRKSENILGGNNFNE